MAGARVRISRGGLERRRRRHRHDLCARFGGGSAARRGLGAESGRCEPRGGDRAVGPRASRRGFLGGRSQDSRLPRRGRRLSGQPGAAAVRSDPDRAARSSSPSPWRRPPPRPTLPSSRPPTARGPCSATRPSGFWPSIPEARSRPRPSKGRDRAPPSPRRIGRRRRRSLGSAKDRAEHVMIVDLERNDLGRVCQTGTVEVASLAAAAVVADRPPSGQHRAWPLAAWHRPRRVAGRHLSRRIDHGRAQAARHADHRRAGAGRSRTLHRRDGLVGGRRRSRSRRSPFVPRSFAVGASPSPWAAASWRTRSPRQSSPRRKRRRGRSRRSAAVGSDPARR